VGRRGRGLGEFVNPGAIAIGPRGDIFIADITRRVQVFRKAAGGYLPVRSFRLEFAARDMCMIGSELFVHARAAASDDLIYAVDTAGHQTRSFGLLYRSPNRLINAFLPAGKIACAEREGIILYAPLGGVGELRGYSTKGQLLWVSTIKGYEPFDYVQPAGDVHKYGLILPKGGYHGVVSITYHPAGFFVVQVARYSGAIEGGGSKIERVYTFVVSARDGSGISLGDSVPPISALDRKTVLSLRNASYPTIEVRHLDGY
jgi:hypothetical protein